MIPGGQAMDRRILAALLGALLAAATACDSDEGDDDTAADDDTVAENRPPEQPQVTIYPDDPIPTDELWASIDNFNDDPDGDELAYTYTWKRDGEVLAELTTAYVAPDHTAKGEAWIVNIVAADAEYTTAPGGDTTLIGNTPPTAPSNVAIEPAEPTADDMLTCTGDVVDDPDGDPQETTFRWYLDGDLHANVAETLAADDTETGQQWECEIVVSDGEAERSNMSEPVTIL